MSKMKTSQRCVCSDCGTVHYKEHWVELEELPMGIECAISPNEDKDETWTLTIIDHTKEKSTDLICQSMKDCLWNIEFVAMRLHRPGNRFVVSTSKGRFETHSRINRAEWNDWTETQGKQKVSRLAWYEEIVRKAARGYVRSVNKSHRLGFNKPLNKK